MAGGMSSLAGEKDTGEDAWGDSLRFTAYPYDPVDYATPKGEFGHIAAAAFGSTVIGGVNGFVSLAVSQHMRGEKFSFRKAFGAVTGAARGAMMASGFGVVTMFAGDAAAGTVGNMLNRAISGERQNLGESLWEGTLNAVGNAVFVKDPIGSLKGAGKKPINGFRDVFRRGAEAAGVTTLMNDLAQMSGIVGGRENPDSGSRYSSSTLGRATTGFDRSAINTGGYTGGKQDPRTLCEPSDTFSGGIGSQSTRGYQQTGGNKRKSRFSFGKLVGDVIVNSLLGGFTSTMYYGVDRAVGAVSDGIRGRRNRQQKLGKNESGSGTNIDNPVDLTDFRKNHILNNHRYGAGKPDKTEFPQNWSDKKILHYVSDVATDPNATWKMGRWNSPYAIDVREGIEIRVDFYPEAHPKYSGKISTAYPLNTPKNPPKGGEN